jgi:hypothetical protein
MYAAELAAHPSQRGLEALMELYRGIEHRRISEFEVHASLDGVGGINAALKSAPAVPKAPSVAPPANFT